jgi:hypothetical protein
MGAIEQELLFPGLLGRERSNEMFKVKAVYKQIHNEFSEVRHRMMGACRGVILKCCMDLRSIIVQRVRVPMGRKHVLYNCT